MNENTGKQKPSTALETILADLEAEKVKARRITATLEGLRDRLLPAKPSCDKPQTEVIPTPTHKLAELSRTLDSLREAHNEATDVLRELTEAL